MYCAVAQTGQVLGVLNRSGNVHDSNGAKAFVRASIAAVRAVRRRRTLIEVRVDSVFFGDEILTVLEHAQVRFTISVPFAAFSLWKKSLNYLSSGSPLTGCVKLLEELADGVLVRANENLAG